MCALDLLNAVGAAQDEYVCEACFTNAKRPIIPEEKNIANFKSKTTCRGMKRSMLIAAIVSILLLLVGCTVAYIFYPSMMETILGENGSPSYVYETVRGLYEPGGERTKLNARLAQKYIEPYIFPVEGSISDGGTTLTALSCIVDRTSCTAAVYLKLENPPTYEIYNSGKILFTWQGKWDGWYIYPSTVGQDAFIGRCFIDSTSTTEDTLYCVIAFSCEPACKELELQIGDASDKIAIHLPEKTHLPSIDMENGDIQISPFGMKVNSSLLEQDDKPSSYVLDRHELAIRFKDGNEYLILHTGFMDDEDYVGYTYGMALNIAIESRVFIFNRVVDINTVSAIRINNRIYPVL